MLLDIATRIQNEATPRKILLVFLWTLLLAVQFEATVGSTIVLEQPSLSIALRGGSVRSPDSRKRRVAGNDRRSSTTASESSAAPADELLLSGDAPTPVPIIDAVLIPRRLTYTRLIGLISLVAATVSFLGCVRTARMPYVASVWKTLHHDAIQPLSFDPSSLDVILAHAIAQTNRDMLPPRYLPASGPLISFLLSLLLWVSLSILLPRWFTHVQVFMNYQRKNSGDGLTKGLIAARLREDASGNLSALVKIPRDQRDFESVGRSRVVRPLHNSPSTDHPCPFYFELQHRRVYCNLLEPSQTCIDGGPTLHLSILRDLLSPRTLNGLSTERRLRTAKEQYGPYSSLSLPQPTIKSAFYNRISSPLAVLQLLGRLLSALEENLLSSMLGLATTLLHHYVNARQSIISGRELANEVKGSVEDSGSIKVWALRPKKDKVRWTKLSAMELLPGDVFTLGATNNTDMVMPVDALLLEGNIVMNEAVLTGETVPQAKLPLDVDIDSDEAEKSLDLMGAHRSSILFAGTSLVYCASAREHALASEGLHPVLPDKAKKTLGVKRAKLMVLRTGAYSTRGDMLRALAKSSGHVGAISSPQSERDAIRLILSLSAFAAIACASVFQGDQATNMVSPFRRAVQCTRIAVASIPSDLPLALSSIAQTCASVLRKEGDVACTEPGSLLTAAQVDAVVFDKTGTLTADTQSLSKIVPAQGSETDTVIDPMTNAVLAGCHSLVCIEDSTQLVGDPLDKAALVYSNWRFNSTEDAFTATGIPEAKQEPTTDEDPIKLWQIKTFPFDANRRTSSALVLVLQRDMRFRLWKVTKGSPDTMLRLISNGSKGKRSILRQVASLEASGLRAIAMAAKDVTNDLELTRLLFPRGLSVLANEPSAVANAILLARDSCDPLHRDAVESDLSYDFVGLACFEAAIRPSTERVLVCLKAAGLKVTILTGDGINAAISVAQRAGLMGSSGVRVLDVSGDELVCRKMDGKRIKNSARERMIRNEDVEALALLTETENQGLVATGDAVESLMSDDSVAAKVLGKIDVVARASPKQKQEFVASLKRHCGKRVLMCGDGVNDVSAMKRADVAVALLNGFGEEQTNRDTENKRRLQRLSKRRIGSNRLMPVSTLSLKQMGGIESADGAPTASLRVKADIELAIQEIRERALTRAAKEGSVSSEPVYTTGDMKDILCSYFRVVKKEYKRARDLQKGGAAAARILAKEEYEHNADPRDVNSSTTQSSTIKPGEASLAASFSCLRPSIAGVDSLLRTAVAAAACSLSVQQSIALNCLMSCYNLATLYRDGFRYGKMMWNLEFFFYTSISQASYLASCTPRPVLSYSRPDESLFAAESLLNVLSQAFIHLLTLNEGTKLARQLEKVYSPPEKKVLIRTKASQRSGPRNAITILSEALVETITTREPKEKRRRGIMSLLGRPPFQPNYATNFVFIMSNFQYAVSTVANHQGKPFCVSILESRRLCLSIATLLLFCVACVMEVFPNLNEFLELRRMNSPHDQIAFLSLLAMDLVACFASKWISTSLWSHRQGADIPKTMDPHDATVVEQNLLEEESKQNRSILLVLSCGALVKLLVSGFFNFI